MHSYCKHSDYYFFSLSFYREFSLCNYKHFIHITFYDHFKLYKFTWPVHTLEIEAVTVCYYEYCCTDHGITRVLKEEQETMNGSSML